MNEIIFFTKAPNLTNSKTRLGNFLNETERLELMRQLIKQNYELTLDTAIDYVIYYSGDLDDISFLDGDKKQQVGDDLGERMKEAFYEELTSYDKIVLFGTDLENLTKNHITEAFDKLDSYDVVLAPAADGGYGLVALKEPLDIFSSITYSTSTVLDETINMIKGLGKTYYLLDHIRDIDTMDDLLVAEFDDDRITHLGSGEYNLNYLLDDKVIRINLASQMNLGDQQLKYEYEALKALETSGVTPKIYDYHKRGKYLPKSYLSMEYIEGRPLDYYKDMDIAARLLSTVHNHKADFSNFIYADKPFRAMYEEFKSMYSHYLAYPKRDEGVVEKIDKLMAIAEASGLDSPIVNPCIINTELNNKNFIIGDRSVVIDWEKPIIGECEQDLAHFLVPTTTNWKTDVILTEEEMLSFLKTYEAYRPIDYDKFYKYLMFNSLRGLTWCSMAKVEYETERFINNADTYAKINKFLSKEFLNMIERFYI